MGQLIRSAATAALATATLPAMAQVLIHNGYNDPSQVQGNAAWSTQVINGVGNNSHLPIVTITNGLSERMLVTNLSAVVTRTQGTPATDDWYAAVHTSSSDLFGKTSWDSNATTFSLGGAPSSWMSYGGRLELKFDNLEDKQIFIDPGHTIYFALANKAAAIEGAVRLSTSDLTQATDDYTYKGDRIPTVLTLANTPGTDNPNFAYNVYATPVPEPAGLAALTLGVAALAGIRRRQK